MAAVEVDMEREPPPQHNLHHENDHDTPPTPNFSLNRVGSMFPEAKSSSDLDSGFYVLGSIGRLCNDVDDITLESSSTRTAPGSNSPELAPLQRAPTALPLFGWASRTSTLVDDGTSLDDMRQKRRNPGSSLAPQSSSDPSDDERSEAPSVGQFRPGTDLIQCPVEGCERTFKWKKNLHHHIRDKHPTDAAGLSVMRVQPAHVGAAHNGFRLQSIAIAPPPLHQVVPAGADPGLRCPECGKTFSRKGDLVHHKRYHTRSTDRPYKCEQCGQGFIHHKDLARHMPRHTGQRSFQCPYPECHKNYTRKDNLNRHMRHDHGGLGASGEVWTGVEALPVAPPPASSMPMHINIPQSQPQPQEMLYEPPIDPAIPISSHLTAIAEAASNHALLQEPSNMTHHPPIYPSFGESSHDSTLVPTDTTQDTKMESTSSETSTTNGHPHLPPHPLNNFARETTPSLGKRPADDLERISQGLKPKRKPKEKWAHRLGCPFRKHRSDMFTTEHGYRVCETTPHEFIIRLIEHMKRNHELYVCGECFLGFRTPDALNSHKTSCHHCGKCYLSYADEGSFIQHAAACVPVDAATQEDIWQILYETLCGDGVRHNPSFDEDGPPNNGTIQPNNRIRMQLLAQQPLAPGQVPSLAMQLGDPGPVTTAGNAMAPSGMVQRGESQRRLGRGDDQSALGGAALAQAQAPRTRLRDREGSPLSIPISEAMGRRDTPRSMLARQEQSRETIQVLRELLDVERQARREAEERADVLAEGRKQELVQTAVRRFVSTLRRPKRRANIDTMTKGEVGFVEDVDDSSAHTGEFDGGFAMYPPSAFTFTSSSFSDPSIGASNTLTHAPTYSTPYFNFHPTPAAAYTPSLTSSTTLPSIDDPLLPPPNLTRSLTALVADMAQPEGRGSDELEGGDGGFVWGGYHPWDCQRCGKRLGRVESVFCEGCGNGGV